MTGAELENAPMMLDGAATDGSIAPRSTSRPAVRDSLSQVDLTIVGGAGHVGIPLVLCFAESGLQVQINDRNEAALRTLMNGKLPFIEYDAQPLLDSALARGTLTPASRPSDIGRKGPVIVTIGTPMDEFLNPVHGAVKECVDELLPHIADGQLLILRSTVYPGTTDWLSKYLAHQGRRLRVAFCPERVVQGYGIRELKCLPQVVSGTTPEAEEEVAALFRRIAPEVVRVKPLEAEFSKIFANVYRYLEFATTNQFYMIAQSAGADYHEILRAMKQNYPRAARIPGPGFAAGPCLFKDTMQLASFSQNQFALGHAAMLVNEGLVLYVIEQLRQTYDLGNCTVGLLGMAFKPEVDDTRSSLSYKLKKGLSLHAEGVLTTDPFVKSDPTLIPVEDVVERSDVLVLCTPHKAYEGLDTKGKPIFDMWHPANPRPLMPDKAQDLPCGQGEAGHRAHSRPPAADESECELDLVIPVYNEGANILGVLRALDESIHTSARVLICYDFAQDDTLTAIREGWTGAIPVIFVRNLGRGAHGAVMTGLRFGSAPFALVFPADDDYNPAMLEKMVEQARGGADIVCASRFMKGGSMVNCPWLKALLIRSAAFTLRHFAGIPTHDPTNGFRLFSRRVIESIEVESERGFSYSLELLVKAHRLRWRIAEVPARWSERAHGKSRFKVLGWLPAYLKWYGYAFATTYLRRPASTVRLNQAVVK